MATTIVITVAEPSPADTGDPVDGDEPISATAPSASTTVTTEADPSASASVSTEPDPDVPIEETEEDSDRVAWMHQFVQSTDDHETLRGVIGSPTESGLEEQVWAAASTSVAASITAGLTGQGWEAFPELYGTAPVPWPESEVITSGAMRSVSGDVFGLVVWSGVNPDGEPVEREWVFVRMTADGTRPESP